MHIGCPIKLHRNTPHSFLCIIDITRKAVTFEINQDVYCREESGGEEREDGDSDAVLEKLLEIRACTHKRAKETLCQHRLSRKHSMMLSVIQQR